MSKRMVQAFFPAAIRRLQQWPMSSFVVNECIFPDSIAEMCPEPKISISRRDVRLPFLFLAAVLGMGIGLQGFFKFYRQSRRHRRQQEKSLQQQQYSQLFSLAFLTFGIMNFSGALVHCVWDAPFISYPESYPFFWACDTYMTGFSSICLFFGSLEYLLLVRRDDLAMLFPALFDDDVDVTNNNNNTTTTIVTKRGNEKLYYESSTNVVLLFWAGWVACQAVGVACVLYFMWAPSRISSSTMTKLEFLGGMTIPTLAASHPLELWYLLPLLFAGIPVTAAMFFNEIRDVIKDGRIVNLTTLSLGQLLLLLGSLVAGVLGIGMDWLWCTWFRDLFLDLLTASTLTFLGCDLMFLGIYFSILDTAATATTDIGKNDEDGDVGAKEKAA